SRVLDDCTDPEAWTATSSGAVSFVSDDPVRPLALQIDTPAGSPGTYTTVSRDLVTSMDGRFLSMWVKPLDGNFNRIGLAYSVGGRGFTQRFESTVLRKGGTIEGQWRRLTIPNSTLTANGSPTPGASAFGDVRAIRLEVFPDAEEATSIL